LDILINDSPEHLIDALDRTVLIHSAPVFNMKRELFLLGTAVTVWTQKIVFHAHLKDSRSGKDKYLSSQRVFAPWGIQSETKF
jgi:hypothetical protein